VQASQGEDFQLILLYEIIDARGGGNWKFGAVNYGRLVWIAMPRTGSWAAVSVRLASSKSAPMLGKDGAAAQRS